MGWFKSKKPETARLPFEPDRIAALNTVIPVAVERGIRMRQDETLTLDDVIASKFFNGYVCSYPIHLEACYGRVGGPVRYSLLKMFFNCSDAEAQLRFELFKKHMNEGDDISQKAHVIGEEDGKHYFDACIYHEDANDKSTELLILAIRTQSNFEPLSL